MEQKIYVNQTALQIQLDTHIDLTTLATPKIKYTNPAGTSNEWPAVLVGPAIDGVIGTANPPTLVNGLWTCWAHLTFADGRTAPGDPVTFYAYTEGQLS